MRASTEAGAVRPIEPRVLSVLVGSGLLVVFLGAILLFGPSPGRSELTVFAAASLRDVMDDLEAAWQGLAPDQKLVVSFGGSNVLAAQIAEGAPADVFLSADTSNARQLAEDGLTSGVPVVFAHNALALVTPQESEAVAGPSDLSRAGIRIVAAGPGVPISVYSGQLIDRLAAMQPDAVMFRQGVDANIASREDNVRAALAKVELGEGDAAIVYRTDAITAEGIRVVPLPAEAELLTDYAAVAVSDHPDAQAFVDWLAGPEATAVLTAAGFEAAAG